MSFNTGAFGEGFPYSNFHDLNMDWIIKIAKDFLDQYTHIQEIIEQGKTDIQNLTESGLTQLQDKADNLEALLQAWYNEHSEDIANQLASALSDLNEWYNEHSQDIAGELADALADLNAWYTEHTGFLDQYVQTSIDYFNSAAENKAAETLESIPADYTDLSDKVSDIGTSVGFQRALLTRNVLDGRDAIGKTPQEIDYQNFYCGLNTHLFTFGFNNVTLFAEDINGNPVSGCAFAPVYDDDTLGQYDYVVNTMYNKNNFTNYEHIKGINFRAYSAATTVAIAKFGVFYNALPYEEYEEYYHSWADDKTIYNGYNKQTAVEFTLVSGSVIGTDGSVAQNQYYEHTEIRCKPGETYIITGTGFGNPKYPLITCRSLTGAIINSYGTGMGYATIQLMIPEDTIFVLVNNENRYGDIHIYKCEIENPSERLVSPVDYDNYWKGKQIVWFGTSIPAGVVNAGESGGNGSYPVRLAERLGATMYNESIGSSSVTAGSHGSAVTPDDPMGYGGKSALGLFLSMSLSSTEKEEIYNNWDSKWQYIVGGGEAIDWDNMQKYYNSSWDIMLAKYLTGGSVGPVDCYVFDHGFNDRGQSILDTPTDPDDRRYFYGAMSFLFKKILEDNPKATIIICGHYSDTQTFMGGTDLVKWVCEAQTELSKHWSFPIIKTWEKMGFSFVTFTYEGTPTTVLKQWMPDGVHPDIREA